MSGNTKLLGFGAQDEITLERWGKTASAKLDPAAIHVLRHLCHSELPKKPPERQSKEYCGYDFGEGNVEITLPPEKAKILADILQTLADSTGIVPEEKLESDLLNNLPGEIYLSLQEHEAYINTADEPGVD